MGARLPEDFQTGRACDDSVPACPGATTTVDSPATIPKHPKAHLFFIGDSTDKLQFHAACNLILPENERCGYQCTDPGLRLYPRNVQQHLCAAGLGEESTVNVGDQRSSAAETGTVNESECCNPSTGKCCMSDSMVASSPACRPGSYSSGLGSVGFLHTCGADEEHSARCNNAWGGGGSGVPNVYSADGLLPPDTLARINISLPSFVRWTRRAGAKPRPVVTVVQSGMWDMEGSEFGVPRGKSDDTMEGVDVETDGRVKELLDRHVAGLKRALDAAKDALHSVNAPTDCMAFRTIDIFRREPVVAKARAALIDEMNKGVLALGERMGVPVYQYHKLAEAVEKQTGGYWWDPMHQRSSASTLQVKAMMRFVAHHMPPHCALR